MKGSFQGSRKVWVIVGVTIGFLGIGGWWVSGRSGASGFEGAAPREASGERWVRAVPGPVLAVAGSAGDHPLYVGTARGLYRSEDEGRRWRRVFAAGLWGKPVQAIWMLPGKERRVWIAVGSRLYFSEGEEVSWEPRARLPVGILCGAADPWEPSRLLIGTTNGLYESSDAGRSGRPVLGLAPQGSFSGVVFDPNRVGLCFSLSDRRLFRSEDGGRSWVRMTGLPLSGVAPSEEETDRLSEEAMEEDGPEEALPATGSEPLQPKLAADPGSGALYVSTGQGIFRSLDTGWEWASLPAQGMERGREVPLLLMNPVRPGSLFALSGDRLYLYHSEQRRWETVREDLPPDELPAEQRLFRKFQETAVSEAGPSVQQVQKVAIAYAEVGPEKIRRWRGLARWSAFIPSFTLGLDQDRDANVVSSTSAGITKFSVGPDHHSRSVDFGFTWHLADFVWNPDQTSIDVRSRLTTQLRQDLLEEVTRLYFERKRLLAEFGAQPAEDPALRKERALRVQELTAYLDALTGGWFSRQLEHA